MKLHTLIHYLLPFMPVDHLDNPEITSIEDNSQNVKPGSLFICINGYTVDGHDYAQSAVKAGAVAIIAERELPLDVPVVVVKDSKRSMALLADFYYSHPTQSLHLIGITGTNGKTTTSHLIEKIFSDHGEKTGLIGTMYSKIGDQIYDTKNTTPESLMLQKTFKNMIDEEVTTAVMEVSSHALVEGRVHGCDYDVAVFTNLSQDHLDFHKTMEEYEAAKGLLFAQLGNVYHDQKTKYAVLNADDKASKKYKTMTAARVVTYGIDHDADFKAINIRMTAKGTSFELQSPLGNDHVEMKLIGKFNVYNVLASIATAFVSNISLRDAIKVIEETEGVSGRFEAVNAGQDFSVIVDYAHTPDSLENVLKTIRQFAKKRIFVVVGCGGDRDKTKRPLMAKISCELATDPVFTSDNPRTEDPEQILRDMESGVEGKVYQSIIDRKQAIQYVVNEASTGDVILIAGKGHETYQIIGKDIIDFDDRLVAKTAIEERFKRC
ncbi:UDP-N-acetylmuramoyl-L-alanyl-D-glutamate--2,6-diaminopimelate ligase [Niallia sp. Krafla_26]|uniref:UDP-N-acetylmuramoyl-L-alanyl-D-glutamate--2, 6-diaminopimelate ligase n=1 Tax=Niallia sp. Krafla_26 TaxID=3064703 RepID=UPI003D1737FC